MQSHKLAAEKGFWGNLLRASMHTLSGYFVGSLVGNAYYLYRYAICNIHICILCFHVNELGCRFLLVGLSWVCVHIEYHDLMS